MMKLIMMKVTRAFKETRWLSVTNVAVLAIIGVVSWNWGLNAVGKTRSQDSVNALYEVDIQKEMDTFESGNDAYEDLHVEIHDGQIYLYTNAGDAVFGPCRYIYDDNGSSYNGVFRFVDKNGLIGYAKGQGAMISILHKGKFIEASKMSDGSACVKEGDYYYYIDEKGKQFTFGEYVKAYPFGESQGCFARVKKKDGKWSIIDRSEKVVLEGFDSINELPYFTVIGSGVKAGRAVLFSLEYWDNMQPAIIHTFEEFTDISVQYGDCDYAVVTDENGNKGVIFTRNGEILIPSEYVDIQYGYMIMAKGKI